MEKTFLSRALSLIFAVLLVAGFAWVDMLQARVPRVRSVPAILNESGAVMDAAEFLQLDGIDLNTADSLTLRDLPGIGPVLARRIVAYRKENGPFATVEALDAVRGIGAATLKKLELWGYVA